MRSVPNSAVCVKLPRQMLGEPARLPRRAEDDPYAWLYDVQANFGPTLPCAAKSVALALWARACTHQFKVVPKGLAQETGLESLEVDEALRILVQHRLISITLLQSGVWHFYLLPAQRHLQATGR